jgi:hypothetical protein
MPARPQWFFVPPRSLLAAVALAALILPPTAHGADEAAVRTAIARASTFLAEPG